MSFALILVGANHKVASIEVREKLAIPKSRLPDSLRQLVSHPAIAEACVLSTCNRTEVYVLADPEDGPAAIRELLCREQGICPGDLAECLYEMSEQDCIRHLFEVTAGLDSMILGEVQILGQVREAYTLAAQEGAIGKLLDAFLRKALEAGRRARNETEISSQAASVSYAAVELAKKIFGDLSRSVALVVGAGEMGELVAHTLVDNGVKGTFFANRTLEKATELAQRYGGTAVPFSELATQLRSVDIVISSTDAPHAIIRRDMVEECLRARRGRPVFLIDLAVPRDIDPAVNSLEGAFVYNVDDLQAVVEANLRERSKEVRKVERILVEELAEFVAWREALAVQPAITALRKRAEEIRQGELAKHRAKLEGLSPEQANAIEALTLGIVNKMLHPSMVTLKTAAGNGTANHHYLKMVEELFGLSLESKR